MRLNGHTSFEWRPGFLHPSVGLHREDLATQCIGKNFKALQLSSSQPEMCSIFVKTFSSSRKFFSLLHFFVRNQTLWFFILSFADLGHRAIYEYLFSVVRIVVKIIRILILPRPKNMHFFINLSKLEETFRRSLNKKKVFLRKCYSNLNPSY